MLGSALALALGALAAPTQAASAVDASHAADTASSGSAPAKKASWHFWKSYWHDDQCRSAGKRVLASNPRYMAAACLSGTGTDGKPKWHLYILY
ncbi:hypothetical protein DZF91_10660 [Actinomadura logoneensis]|uniref:Uncharacterized protein n=1 Tax=Actinomadura logoneensis TaxID=2293572 RepID=A0A372JNT6_9ACTN|nr:hypothetical protein [Actinomadura logoneensis]RFU41630.1 hypothetical protein DZF91_10660 [Actinomadura logoneensis]